MDIHVARVSAMVIWQGRRYRIQRGRTTAREGHPILREHPDAWAPLRVDFDVEQATAAPGERRNVQLPDNRAIREWAEANGYEVSPRGKLPAEVVEAYRLAHQE